MSTTGNDGRKSSDDRKAAMGQALSANLARGGYRVESQGDFNAVLVKGKPINNVLHLVLTLITFGFWGIIWIIMFFIGGEKREMITVDDYGNVSIQQL
ncbi:unannotated protein [freshwater metagenome]|uniref:Unannotated protein n=1 Tax=freshwater metagenome TaxID=449393 RepID=A0A6J7JFK4_9ZZZZ|nr:hypothetical protein [Actinomycetota bacterium]